MAGGQRANVGALQPWSSRAIVLDDWSGLSAALDGFVQGTRRDLKHCRVEAFLFRRGIYTVEFRPAGDTYGLTQGPGRDNGMDQPKARTWQSASGYPTIRVSVRTADGFSCHPACDFWSRFIGTLSRFVARVTDRFDVARRRAIGSGSLFESCEQGMERYVRRHLPCCVTSGNRASDVEAVFSDRGLKD